MMKKIINICLTYTFISIAGAQTLPYSIYSDGKISLLRTDIGQTSSKTVLKISKTKDSTSLAQFKGNLSKKFSSITTEYVDNRDKLLAKLIEFPDSAALFTKLEELGTNYKKELRVLKNVQDLGRAELLYMTKTRYTKFLFPAIYARDAAFIYSEDTATTRRFFSNNEVIVQPSNRSMTYSTELYSDYIGPVRIGFGMLVNSKNTTDTATAQKKAEADEIQKLSAGGGNGQLSFRFPFFKWNESAKMLVLNSSFVSKLNFDIPALNNTSKSFNANMAIGSEVFLFSKSLFKIINLFAAYRGMFYWGNENFRESLSEMKKKSFWMDYFSIGIAIKNNYRIRVDYYSGNSFIKNNFPTTITLSTSITK